jgi:hypothetical protein
VRQRRHDLLLLLLLLLLLRAHVDAGGQWGQAR